MLYNPDNLPDDFFDENQVLFEERVLSLPEYYFYLSDIEIQYSYTVVEISWLHPSQYTLKLPGTLYKYIPDQKPLTLQLLGKPSLGPSPPFPTEYTGMPRAGCGTVKYSYNFSFLKNITQ
jgi:hypothetical protein